jgi:hypothetical protein
MADSGPGLPVLKVVGGLLGLLSWVFFLGLQRVWRWTFGWIFTTLAALLDAVRIPIPLHSDVHPFGAIADWLRSLNRNVAHQLALFADRSEHLAVWLFSRVRLAFSWVRREIENLAADVLAMGLRIVRVTVPHLVARLLRFVWKELRALGRYARRMIPKLARQLFRFSKWATHEILKGARHVGFLWKWFKAVVRLHWRAILGAWKAIRGIEHRLVPKRFRGLGFLFGGNVQAVGSWLLVRDRDAVWEFVKDAVRFGGRQDLCQLAAYQFDIAVYVFEPVMQKLIGVTDWVCRHEGHTLPSATADTPRYAAGWAPSATPPIDTPFTPKRLAPNVPLPRGVIEA